jgi:uncharacterized protein (TIGR03382 family)
MFFGTANANMINIELDNVNPSVGDTVSVNINMTDIMSDFSAFTVGFHFDSSIFEFVDDSTSSYFPISDIFAADPSGLDIDTFSAPSGDLIFSLFSFTDPEVVYGAGDYLVASFDLLAIAEGQSSLSLLDTFLFAPDFGPETALDKSDSTASIAVSAPSSMAFMGLAVLGFLGFRRKV